MCISDFLQSRSVRFELLLHRPAHSATHLAGSLHLPGRSVAKAVLVRADDRFALAVLPATHRVDPDRLAEILNVGSLRIATEDEVESVFADCEPGALPPFGQLYGLQTVVDASLSGGSDIAFMGNTRHEGVRMRFRDYEAVESPIKARFASPIAPRRLRNRKAG
ncbi:aminoacyl-tRNA deacylase [Tundrisphaera lichenicola]|uniref:aminoacyl-tRNA deacylase n=1 Tax=Tundrisphaera lichenicola TaxID=2029860 RepID=UPI003EB77EB8